MAALTFLCVFFINFFLKLIVDCVLFMGRKIMIPMYRL